MFPNQNGSSLSCHLASWLGVCPSGGRLQKSHPAQTSGEGHCLLPRPSAQARLASQALGIGKWNCAQNWEVCGWALQSDVVSWGPSCACSQGNWVFSLSASVLMDQKLAFLLLVVL